MDGRNITLDRNGIRQVFWLTDHPTRRTFPSRPLRDSGILRLSSPITAAGPRRNCTVFPFESSWQRIPEPVHFQRTD